MRFRAHEKWKEFGKTKGHVSLTVKTVKDTRDFDVSRLSHIQNLVNVKNHATYENRKESEKTKGHVPVRKKYMKSTCDSDAPWSFHSQNPVQYHVFGGDPRHETRGMQLTKSERNLEKPRVMYLAYEIQWKVLGISMHHRCPILRIQYHGVFWAGIRWMKRDGHATLFSNMMSWLSDEILVAHFRPYLPILSVIPYSHRMTQRRFLKSGTTTPCVAGDHKATGYGLLEIPVSVRLRIIGRESEASECQCKKILGLLNTGVSSYQNACCDAGILSGCWTTCTMTENTSDENQGTPRDAI